MTSGAFVRQDSRFRGQPHGGPERHHLYVALACPWSQRAVIARAVLGVEIGISYAHPDRDERGWAAVDLGSTNGMKVNGHRTRHAELSSGDRITIGVTDLTFELE